MAKANPPNRPPGGMEARASQPARRLRPIYPIVIAVLMVLAGCGQQPLTAPTVRSAAEQIAPTVQAAQTSVRATLATGATEIAPTVQAARTEVAAAVQMGQATLEAAQTQIAPTAQAVATAIAATIQPPIATSVAASAVQIAAVKVSQEDTTVALSSTGAEAANVSGWVLFIGTFPLILPVNTHMRIDPNETVTLHFSRGTDTDSDVYLGQAPERLVNSMQPGTRFALMNLQGEIASVYRLA